MLYVGVDPGQKGGFALIADASGLIYVRPWNDQTFVQQMNALRGQPVVACVEKVGAMPGQGVTSMFHFGKSAGFIEGVLTACGISYELVPPQRWKKFFGLHSDKQESIELCKRLFPSADLLPTKRCRKPSDGMAEALLIAEYASKKCVGSASVLSTDDPDCNGKKEDGGVAS